MTENRADVSGFAYRPALDGVRGLAVLAVIGYHGGVSWLAGGFLGVDAFFVLSGYLITSLLLAERARTGRIRLVAFWSRRARRLLPALLIMLATVVVVGRLLLDPTALRPLRADALAALLYVANWRMVLGGTNYFAQTASPSPLQHTWSLGIEEQFYLVWPLLLLCLLRVRRWVLLALCVAGAAGSTAAAWLLYRPTDPGRAYFGTDTRAAALLVGCGLAVLLAGRAPGPRARRLLGMAALAGAGLTVAGWTLVSGADQRLYHGGLLVAALAVAAVIAHAVTAPDGITARLLAVRPLRMVGLISYGLYLWHWPVDLALTADRTGLSGWRLLGLRVAVTLAIAVASYLLVERPLRTGAGYRLLHRLRVAPLAASAGVVAVAAVVVWSTAVPAPPGPPLASGRLPAGAAVPREPPPDRGGETVTHHVPPGAVPRVDVLGDSVAWTIANYLPKHPGIDVEDRTVPGCGIAVGNPYKYFDANHLMVSSHCPYWEQIWQQGVDADNPDVAMILVGRWEVMDRMHDGVWMHVGEPAYDAYLTQQLETAVRIAGSHGAHVVLCTFPYSHRGERSDGSLYVEDTTQRMDAWNALIRQVAGRHAGQVTLLDLNRRACPDGRFTWSVNGIRIRGDGLHFTVAGIKQWIAPWLLPQLAQLATA